MKRYAKWGGVLLLTPVLLFVFLSLLFYFPPFQRWAVRQAAAYASGKTGMQISVGSVRLSFPLDLALADVRAFAPNDTQPDCRDTVALVGRVVASVQLWPLLRSQVMVDRLGFDRLHLNTTHFIPAARIRGQVGRLDLRAHGIDLSRELARVDAVRLSDARLDIALSDTVPPDTAPSTNFWKLCVARLSLRRTALTLHLPGDTLSVAARMDRAEAVGTWMDLHRGLYTVGRLDWQGGLAYDQNFVPRTRGLDYSHLQLSALRLRADSFYYGDSQLRLAVREAAFAERSGLAVSSMRGTFTMDSTHLALSALRVRTAAGTDVALGFAMDLNAFADVQPGTLQATLRGQIGRQDLLLLAADNLPRDLARHWPRQPLVVHGGVGGNLQRLRVRQLALRLPTALSVRADGFLEHLDRPDRLRARLQVQARTDRLDFVAALLPPAVRGTVRIPRGIGFRGQVDVDGPRYASRFTATQGGGSVGGMVWVDAGRMAYEASLSARALPLRAFLPRYPLHAFTGSLTAHGQGTDPLSSRTRLQASAAVSRFGYGPYDLAGVRLDATVSQGRVQARVDSRNSLLRGTIAVSALTGGRRLRATVGCDIAHADLHALRLVAQPLVVSGCAHVDLASDLRQYHRVQGTLSDMTLRDSTRAYRPQDVGLDIVTSRDTTHAIIDCADFHLNMDASGGYERLLARCNAFVGELQRQLRDKTIDQLRLRRQLPLARVYLRSGKDNMVCRILRHYGYALDRVLMDLTASPVDGLDGRLQVDSLVLGGFQMDTVRFRFDSDAEKMTYTAQLRNGPKNPDYVFNALFDGSIDAHGTSLQARVYDHVDRLGVRLGLRAAMEAHGVSLHLVGDRPVLGYKEFSVNDSNYLFLGDDRRIRADMALRAADGTGLQVYTNDSNAVALQDVTVSLHRFNIGDALAMIPYTPDVEGILDGDFHLIQTASELSVSSSVGVRGMVYEGCPMGNVATEFTYMPKSDGSHYVDGTLSHNGAEVGTLTGTYVSAGRGVLDATLSLERLPLELANGFIPDRLFGFKGYAEGDLSVRGSLARPDVNGEVFLDSAYIFSEPYGVEMRFANDPVSIEDSRLQFENFEVFAHNDSPLNVKGYFDFSDMSRMLLDVRMRADNYLLVDARETGRSEAYGKAYVNFFGLMQGPVDNLRMRGRVEVLGTTDLKYNLKDSPLSTDNQLQGLVDFVDFRTSAATAPSRPPLTGLDMDLSISIDDGAHVDCYLNADHSNYIDVVGGGDMRMQYSAADNLRLTGRYTIGSGEMKYSLPVIPLKTFTIQDGSYIEFRGDPMNPALHLTATEQTKATVGGDASGGRVAVFTCGVVVSQTLSNMGLEFIIDAPDDMTLHNQLQSMSKEDRAKQAVAMLTTGMYLADGNTSSFSMNSALSAFLNSQINQITGKALRSLDVSFGVDNSVNGSGALHTDYSFKFAKRFWNNRLRIVVGGRLSSGADVTPQEETFFDNVTFEYRLSPTSNRYLNLFYQRDSYDWLEGNVSRFGGGFLWKRKLRHFSDLFRFRDDKSVPLPADTARRDSAPARRDSMAVRRAAAAARRAAARQGAAPATQDPHR